MESVASTASENALTFVIELVKRHVGYFRYYKNNVGELKKYVRNLQGAREAVQHRVDDAGQNGEEIELSVQNWLVDVGEKITEYENFLGDRGHARTDCAIGFIPNNLKLRYQLGRKAKKMVEESNTDELVNKNFDRVSYLPPPSIVDALSNIGFESFPSRDKIVDGIMKALGDPAIKMIGVYGPGGVGKTTFVKEVAKKARENELFNVVVIANITRNPDIKKIQGQIAEMLGMRLDEESEIVRASRLQKRLKKEKENTLIILDDLWDGLDLNTLGIPCDDGDDDNDDGDDNDDANASQMVVNDTANLGYNKMKKVKSFVGYRGCKILLTSRRKEVLCSQMDVNENSTFPVGILNEKEAETLLKKEAGIQDRDSQFEVMATEMAKLCAGLPIAIVSIGRALKNKSLFVWEDVHRQLTRQNFVGGQESIEFSIQLSYDHLRTEELKSIFLLSARMGNDPLMTDLVKYCIGLGMLQGVYTIREARDRVHVLVQELKDSSLLVESYSSDRFNVHDIVRDVALSIAFKEKHVFTVKGGKLVDWPGKDKLESYTVISLHYCDIIDELPENIYCPRLEVFHVDSSDPFLKIPGNFFEGMRELKVLILRGFHLSCLPSSIKYLKNLKMLCLERCTLGGNLSIIGELRKLRILSLAGSYIENLSVELGQLGRLQLFDLSNCSKLRVFPSNVISRLNCLEELYMRGNLILWEIEEQGFQNANSTLSELRHLNHLTTLEIHIPNVAHLPRNLFFDQLDSYKIVIGEFHMLSVGDFKMPDKFEAAKVLALQLKDGSDIHSEKGIKMLFNKVENLLLGELNGVHDVLYELNFQGFSDLKHLSIVNNSGIQYIINKMERSHPIEAFPKLESMCLYKLNNLEQICSNQLTEVSFSRLKTIKIKTCGQLTNVFPFFLVTLLVELETIEVFDCDSLKEIVKVNTNSDMEVDKIDFGQLRFLTLQSLPAFSCFYNNHTMSSISQLCEDQVPNVELTEITTEVGLSADAFLSLFNEKVSLPKLECLELSSINIQKIWSGQCLPSSHCFQNLATLEVTDCGNLNYLLSLPMAGSLVNLQNLSISGCEMMENIFSTEDRMEIDVFPILKKMEITCMEKLKNIWHSHLGLLSFQSLDFLIIKECHKLVTVFPSYMGKRFQRLQTLEVIDCKSVENIFDPGNALQMGGEIETSLRNVCLRALPNLVHVWKEDTQGILNLNNLQSIDISTCHNLECLFPLSVAIDLQKLVTLKVYRCRGMKEIVGRDRGSNGNSVMFRFPELTLLSLQHLFELKSFCWGAHTLEWPSLKKLWLFSCEKLEAIPTKTTNLDVKPIFSSTEKVISNLEHMVMGLKEAKWLQDYIGNVHQMHKLQFLVLVGLKNTEILFWLLHRIPNLRSLTFMKCHFKEVWAPGTFAEKVGTVVHIKELEFRNSYFLQKIGFEHEPHLERVERLVINSCKGLVNLVPSSVSFSRLTYLELSKCNRLRTLMAPSTAKGLVQLMTMKVIQCDMMMEIVAESRNEEEKVGEIDFRQLKALELVSLQSLTSFCSSENCDLKLPILEKLVVSECPRMEKFSQRVRSTPSLQKVIVAEGDEEQRWYWEGDLNATIKRIFMDKVSFEYSKNLTLVDHPELNQVWHGKFVLPDNCFRSLKTLVVENCKFLKDLVIPSNVLPYLKYLEELQVRRCNTVEVIFDISDAETKRNNGIAFRLKKLTLEQMPNLKHVWNENPHGIVSFSSLREVVVKNCGSLKTLLPASLARNLVKLTKIEIQTCVVMVEIVGKEDASAHGSIDKFVFEFPCLSSLLLYSLPQLNCFYPGRHHLECPNLESLHVLLCGKLKIFTSEFQSLQEQEVIQEGEVTTSTDRLLQPLLWVHKVIPNLKELTLTETNINLLSDGQFPPDLLLKLNNLELCLDNVKEAGTLPFGFLHKVPNLEFLQVSHCIGLKEIFPSQKLEVYSGIFARLMSIRLWKLHELNSIGLEHSWVKQHCQKLEKLSVYSCSGLKRLVNCAVSFSNLKQLEIHYCHGLEYLFSFSTAKSLVRLEVLIIESCKAIKEILTKGDESASDEIIFGRLSTLALNSLPSLTSFYSGNATLQFSDLWTLWVIQCPKMETFSRGVINAPRLWGINVSFGKPPDIHFCDDLNMTVGRLFFERVAKSACDIERMNLAVHPHLEQIWLGVVPIPTDKCFNNLKSLIVHKCESLPNVIPFNLLAFLCNLKDVRVSNCESVKAIFDVKDIGGDRQMINMDPGYLFSLPLKTLTLKQLPNLEHIWNMNPDGILSLQDLQEVSVTCCQSLKSLFQTSVVANHLVKLYVEDCQGLVEIFAEDETVLDGATEQFIFRCLSSLTLEKLPELKHFYPGKHQLEWPMLKELAVHDCHELKLFSTAQQSCADAHLEDQQAIISVEKVFPDLELLLLRKEDIIMIWQGQFGANLNRVKLLGLSSFHDESDVFPFGFLQNVPNIEELGVGFSSFKEIFSSERPIVDYIGVLSQLKGLFLKSLSKLSSIGLEHPWVEPVLQTLETLNVEECCCLEILVPSTVLFSNLTELSVSKCHGLVYLFTSSTARNLGLLKKMSIDECESIQEIVAKEEDHESDQEIQDEILFGHLNTVSLDSLPRLAGFYLGSAKLECPSLREVSVSECRNMRIFCHGEISAPQMSSHPNTLIREIFDKMEFKTDEE